MSVCQSPQDNIEWRNARLNDQEGIADLLTANEYNAKHAQINQQMVQRRFDCLENVADLLTSSEYEEKKKQIQCSSHPQLDEQIQCLVQLMEPDADELERRAGAICRIQALVGQDDVGVCYESLSALWRAQAEARASFYAANELWWAAGGYGGSIEQAMVGDGTSEDDIANSSRFLDRLIAERLEGVRIAALDAGAGVGRVARQVLLPRCASVHLLEASPIWSARSRVYLRANVVHSQGYSASFTVARLETFVPEQGKYHLVWVQWVLQYLIDADVVRALHSLANGLAVGGLIVVKENRPYQTRHDPRMFQMDTPEGSASHYDILRPDAHHRVLFEQAGLVVFCCEPDGETNFWVLGASTGRKDDAYIDNKGGDKR
mmetsp:Transcript_69628/g.115673  ORF Transcript_69628/g.115673 Transcript_69628/m.115673 type:complete len:376 (-) Transcript_69628:144-1271(-)|eukprot:CAMPEP_0119331200 /NCGR_PEP_ID=MMETSP1333-20130426/80081_1 /TAXON_ID=418940 /ORGANISM="Scyphosphaera apsteinii, Strain RCC1455" /LENGTH=375 /DNA_ID=CAMNT_0007340743 /DNA_START=152 /DNA_END=1279 /DNA_ORIENTATION=-